MFHLIDDCEHPLLYLPGTGKASHETAISGSFLVTHCMALALCLALSNMWDLHNQALPEPRAVPNEAVEIYRVLS